jgi:hypothetical protein
MVSRQHCQLAQLLGQGHFGNQAVNVFHGLPAVQPGRMVRFFILFRSP